MDKQMWRSDRIAMPRKSLVRSRGSTSSLVCAGLEVVAARALGDKTAVQRGRFRVRHAGSGLHGNFYSFAHTSASSRTDK